ncbi:MAG: M23 family metallopeptidase [Acidobacteriota bacterium]|nr:M23 family metallopeptidase [Acidobacteriota bacterium]
MARDDRFYAFIVPPTTSLSRARIRRICFEKKWLKLFAMTATMLFCGCLYGFYGLTQQGQHLRIQLENQHLRAENERRRHELNELGNRVEAVEDTSRKLAEKSGVVPENVDLPGTGGPAMPLESDSLPALEEKMTHLEKDLHAYEAVMQGRGYTPSVWPVSGRLESAFGGRRNPFGGGSYEFHTGQDIDAPWGAPVIAGATGKVSFVGWQNGYGQLVVIDHGGGLTTRYGHLSHIAVSQGTTVKRGEFVGKVGSTGRSTGPHLHYEVRINDDPVNPLRYLLINGLESQNRALN